MKKYINYITSTLMITALLGTCLKSNAQDKKQELSVSVAGPFSFLNYSTVGQTVPGNGISAGLRYSYYLNEGISVGIGAEYQTYRSDVKFASLAGQYTTTDAENESFQFRYKATQLREKQNLGYVNVPITIQYENPGSTKLYIAAGVKVGFAVSGNYETKMDNLTTSGYYPQYNVELFAPAFAGFASTDDIKVSKQDVTTKTSYSATFETGLKQKVGDRSSVYIGLYLDYGLNDIIDKSNKNLVEYNPALPVQLHYNSTLNTQFTNDIRLVSYGLKLRYALR